MRDMFFMYSKGDVRRVFETCVVHASGTTPATRCVTFSEVVVQVI